MKKTSTIISILFMAFTASAQYVLGAQKLFGGTESDIINKIRPTNDGGYIACGFADSKNGDLTSNKGLSDYWIVKFDSTLNIEWQKSMGGNQNDYGSSVTQVSDGGFVIVGGVFSTNGDVSGNHGSEDVWVVKLSSTGTILWKKTLGGSTVDEGRDIIPTSDGACLIVSEVSSSLPGLHGGLDIWLIKLDQNGNTSWQKFLGGTMDDSPNSISQTTDGGFIIAGKTSSADVDVALNHGAQDAWLIKIDSAGTILWEKTYGGSKNEEADEVKQTSDGGFIFVGRSGSSDGDLNINKGWDDVWIVKTTDSGELSWQKSLGGSFFERAFEVQETENHGFLVAGRTESSNGDVSGFQGAVDGWLIDMNSAGMVNWKKTFGGSSNDVFFCLLPEANGNFLMAGTTASNDGDISGNHGIFDGWIAKFTRESVAQFEPLHSEALAHFDLFPNPAGDILHFNIDAENAASIFRLNIMDMKGNYLIGESVNNKGTLQLGTLAAGLYNLCILDNSGIIQCQKFIKE